MGKRILRKLSFWLPVVLWMALIFKFSSGTIPVASTVFWQDFAFKKTGHALLFGALAILIYRGLIGEGINKKKALIWAIIFSTFYGATDEFHQSFTQGREARVRDVIIDGLGAFAFTYVLHRFLPKMPKKVVELATKFQLI